MKRLTLLVLLVGCSGGTEPQGGIVELRNSSVLSVTAAYFAQCSSAEWGPQRLHQQLMPGAAVNIALDAGCWDFRGEYSNGSRSFAYAVQLAAGGTKTITITNAPAAAATPAAP